MPVYKFTDGRKGWFFSFYFNGKKYKKERYNKKPMLTKAEAQACENEYKSFLEDEYNKSFIPEKEKLTILEAFDNYTESKRVVLKASTMVKYSTFRKCYLPCKNKILNDLTIKDVDDWKNSLKDDNCKIETRNKKLKMMNDFLNFCNIHYDLTNKVRIPLENKFKDTEPPKIVNYYTLEQFNLFYSVIDNEFYKTLFRALFFGGFRIGELLGMQVQDFTGDALIVNKTISRLDSKLVVLPPKTKNSYRKVLLDDTTSSMIKELIDSRKKGYIFGDKEPVSQQQIRRENTKYADLANLPRIKLHEFRKSCASLLERLGYSPYSIAARLGHTPKMANDVYIQANSKDQFKIVEDLNKMKKEGNQ